MEARSSRGRHAQAARTATPLDVLDTIDSSKSSFQLGAAPKERDAVKLFQFYIRVHVYLNTY